jgi:hypothetical protein
MGWVAGGYLGTGENFAVRDVVLGVAPLERHWFNRRIAQFRRRALPNREVAGADPWRSCKQA